MMRRLYESLNVLESLDCTGKAGLLLAVYFVIKR